MEILISCSLDGRDLALIKSLININNIYGNLIIKYVDDVNICQVLIAKDYHDLGAVYYALNRESGSKIYIKPELNPKTVRALFEKLSRKIKIEESKMDTRGLHSIEQLVLQHTKSTTSESVYIESPVATFYLDKKINTLFTDQPITDELIKNFSQVKLEEVKFSVQNEGMLTRDFQYQESLDLFKWQLGYSQDGHLINEELNSPMKAFKQVSWPNYGEIPFKQEFIRLSSMLWKRSESYADLIEHSGYGQSLINQFLNATLMSGHVMAVDSTHSLAARAVKNSNPFLEGLKNLFKFR